jgi:sugar phosphate isomerase/epimerase
VAPLAQLAPVAVRSGVTLLVCNTPQMPGSRDVWFAIDGVSHPAVQAAWDAMIGQSARESSTIAIPRLGVRSKMIVTCDAQFDGRGHFQGYRAIGKGNVDFTLTIDLLKGVMFDGYMMLDWPEALVKQLPPAETSLAEALGYLLDRIKHADPPLSAYKKDKNAPNYATAGHAYVERQPAGVSEACAEPGERAPEN